MSVSKGEWKPATVRRIPSPKEVATEIHNHFWEHGQFEKGHKLSICCYNGSHNQMPKSIFGKINLEEKKEEVINPPTEGQE